MAEVSADLYAQASLDMPLLKSPSLTGPLTLQLGHLLLSCVWNLAGVFLISRGLESLGPTASMSTVALLMVISILMVIGANRSTYLYLASSFIAMAGASVAIEGAFSQDRSRWPSEFWRFSGIGLNCLALVGGFWGFIRLYTATKK